MNCYLGTGFEESGWTFGKIIFQWHQLDWSSASSWKSHDKNSWVFRKLTQQSFNLSHKYVSGRKTKALQLEQQSDRDRCQFQSHFKAVKKKGVAENAQTNHQSKAAGNFSNFLFYISILFLNKHMTHESWRSWQCGQYLTHKSRWCLIPEISQNPRSLP